jgi:ATP-binding cassette subfamily A (ABC1) protein 3
MLIDIDLVDVKS